MLEIRLSISRYICKIVNSLVSNFVSVLFDFALRELTILRIYRPYDVNTKGTKIRETALSLHT